MIHRVCSTAALLLIAAEFRGQEIPVVEVGRLRERSCLQEGVRSIRVDLPLWASNPGGETAVINPLPDVVRLSIRDTQAGQEYKLTLGNRPELSERALDRLEPDGGEVRTECNQVIARNVSRNIQLTWGQTKVVYAIYDECLHGNGPPESSCHVLLMVRDEKGNAVPAARVDFTGSAQGSFTAGKYGRVYTGFGFGTVVTAKAQASGFVPQELRFDCSRQNAAIEKDLILKRIH